MEEWKEWNGMEWNGRKEPMESPHGWNEGINGNLEWNGMEWMEWKIDERE